MSIIIEGIKTPSTPTTSELRKIEKSRLSQNK